ncbi:hypothetical protein protein [Babesia ovis]|uniref:Uncharacterized protein n=1 Tax=Babesia ovis TaxID=5869 RepID=A0A9W5WVJ4_BABOV|nr:hypothetical protein protein [Babesia ovis]
MVAEGIELPPVVNSQVSDGMVEDLDRVDDIEQPNIHEQLQLVVRRLSATKVDIPPNQSYGAASSAPSIGSVLFGCENRVLTHKISPSNLFWLRLYKVVLNLGVLLLVVAYSFYIIGLFEPILYLDPGEFTDPDIFQPFSETLPHSLITLYNQQAYFTVAVAGIFSITLPFVKMIVTIVAYVTAVAHRRIQLLLFFGEHPIEKSGIRQEDEGNIKYAREMLIILKLISKFQMVDVVVLLLNAVFLRSAVIWAKPGKGLLYLMIYCLFSIAGAQMINFAVEGEKSIFQTWYAIKYAILPEELSIIRTLSNTVSDDGSSVKGFEATVTKKRWFVSEDFICLMACLNILSCISLMTNEKMLTVAFTMDLRKIFAIDTTTMSYKEILSNVHNMDYGALSVIVLFFLCVLFPMIFSVLFIVCILGYNYCKRNEIGTRKSVEITDSDDDEPCLKYEWDISCTRFVFNICNIISEWSCGEVVALGTMAAYTSMTTADRVKVMIPPLNTCSALFMMGTYGISSFVLVALFYIWNQNVKFEFSHIRIYVKYLESPNRNHIARIMSENNLTEYVPKEPSGPLISTHHCAPPVRGSRLNFLSPYLEFIRTILYSKWLTNLFFGLLTAMTVLLAITAYTLSHESPHVNVKAMDSFMNNQMHEIFALAMKQMPDSVGDCNFKASPPTLPCSGNEPVFSTQNSVHFSLVWISGLRSLSLKKAEYFLSLERRMSFRLTFHIKNLQAYGKVASVEREGLKNMLAGVVKTEGDGFTMVVELSMACLNRSPQIRDLRVDHIKFNGLRLLGHLYTMINAFTNVEQMLSGLLTTEINRILSSRKQVLIWRGISFDLMEFVNLLVYQNWPAKFVCPAPER